jgi:glucose/arabinose dehydrogenase
MMLIISREGTVRVLENPDNRNDGGDYKEDYENNLILDLSSKICDNGERGLLSVAIHPNFEEKRWVYLHYTRWREGCLEDAMLGPQNVLVRYTLNPNTLILENEELLVQGGMLSKTVHNGGAMVFGTDGHLYLATGDGGGDRASAQDKTNLHGKLLRLRDDGSVPENNPYALTGIPCGQSKRVLPPIGGSEGIYCSEIVSWGFSDPTRMVLRPRDSDEMVSIRDARAETVQIFVPKRVWPGDYKRLVADFGLDKIDNLIKDPECLESSCVPPRFTNTTCKPTQHQWCS